MRDALLQEHWAVVTPVLEAAGCEDITWSDHFGATGVYRTPGRPDLLVTFRCVDAHPGGAEPGNYLSVEFDVEADVSEPGIAEIPAPVTTGIVSAANCAAAIAEGSGRLA